MATFASYKLKEKMEAPKLPKFRVARFDPSPSCCSTLYSTTAAFTLAVAVTAAAAAAARLACACLDASCSGARPILAHCLQYTCSSVSLSAALACRTDANTAAYACTASTPSSHNSSLSSSTRCAGRGCPLGTSASRCISKDRGMSSSSMPGGREEGQTERGWHSDRSSLHCLKLNMFITVL